MEADTGRRPRFALRGANLHSLRSLERGFDHAAMQIDHRNRVLNSDPILFCRCRSLLITDIPVT